MADMDKLPKQVVIEQRTYSVPEIAKILGIGRTKAYELCNSEAFRTVRIGRVLRVVKQSFDDWLNGISL